MNMSSNSSKFDWLLSSLTPNESQVPSTAEIIQKCLSVNPFDLKFREANQQINSNGQPNVIDDSQQLVGTSGNLPATSVLTSVLNLPPSLSSSTYSPGIFSNINVLTADIEGEIRKTINLSRKVQQLRENGLLSKQDDNQQLKTPCTSDVLNAVLDMSSNHQLGNGQSSPFIPSTSLIAASLSGLKAALNSTITNNSANNSSSQQNNLVPTSSIPNLKIEGINGLNNNIVNLDGGEGGFTPVGLHGKTMSTPDLHHLSSSLAVPVFKQHSPILSREALAAVFQSSTAAASSFHGIGGQQQRIISRQNSPNRTLLNNEINLATPRAINNNCNNLVELKTSSAAGHSSTALKKDEENWKMVTTNIDNLRQQQQPLAVCPPQITISQQSPYSIKSSPSEYNCNINEIEERDFGGQNAANQHYQGREKHKKHNKKFSCGESSADSQVSSTRGGRGRRSAINDMPPDERRVTILERNKAAAVRYRKRKKEEHDEIVEKVLIIEQEKNALETQNSVLRRELERLTFLLQERESRCICKANQLQIGVSIIGGGPSPPDEHQQRSPSTSSFLNGYSNHHHNHHLSSQIRPGSANSAQ